MTDTFIEGRGVCKTYTIARTALPVLTGASIVVARGETVSIVGKSGAGKSTLLHILGGLDRPDAGTIRVDGQDLYAMRERRRARVRATRIGFVFQSYHLLPEMDVLENVMLPGMALGKPRGVLRRQARELLAQVGLAERTDHRPFELSGGEQQRAAVARALMNAPQLVLADEPTGNLDAATGSQVLDVLFGLVHNQDLTLVLVTHNRDIARRSARILDLHDGGLHET